MNGFIRRSALSLSAVLLLAAAAQALDIVKDGKPAATLVIPRDAGVYQKWAAGGLQDYIKKATGAALRIAAEPGAPKGNLISIGHTDLARRAGVTTDDLKWDDCRLVTKGRVLFLIGRDVEPIGETVDRRGAGAQGTARAAAKFLEDYVGIRWFLPGREGEYIPERDSVSVPDDLNVTSTTAFVDMATRPYGQVMMARYANNYRKTHKVKSYGGHTWSGVVTVEKYFDKHPEYFAMNEAGNRVKWWHLCTSNKDVREILVAEIRKQFDLGFDVVQLGQSDGWRPCLCPECMKLDDHRSAATISKDRPCEKIWYMHEWIIRQCKKSHPNKKISLMLYGPSRWPSKKFREPLDNVIGELAPMREDVVEAWRPKGLKLFTTWMYCFSSVCKPTMCFPGASPKWLQQEVRRYRDFGVIGEYVGPRDNWGLGGPMYYIFGKLAGNPDANVDELMREFCLGVYGRAGILMNRFFTNYYSTSHLAWEFRPFLRSRPNPQPVEDVFMTLYPPNVVRQLDTILRKAETRADTDRARQWLRTTRDSFDGLKAVADMYAAKRAFEFEPAQESLARVKDRVDIFEKWRDRIFSYYPKDYARVREYMPYYWTMAITLMSHGSNARQNNIRFKWGGARYCMQELRDIAEGKKTYRGLGIGSSLGGNNVLAPITWDFDVMSANIGRKKEPKRLVVRRAPGAVKLDGIIDPAEWKGAAVATLEKYKDPGGRIADGATTTARIMYDSRGMYVAYECVEPNIGGMKLKSVGHDGGVYHNDEVEMFLNPECAHNKMLQFMASPVKDAWFDARKGYIKDPLHPKYAALITAWNPEWQYAFNVDEPGKKWTLEMSIPFKSLVAQPPKPGDIWTANFARMRRAGSGQDMSSWIPETYGGDPNAFGEIVFNGEDAAAPRPERRSTRRTESKDGNVIQDPSFENTGPLVFPQTTPWTIYLHPPKSKFGVKAADLVTISDKIARTGKRSLHVDLTGVEKQQLPGHGSICLNYLFSRDRDGLDALRKYDGKDVVIRTWVYYDVISDVGSHGPSMDLRPSGKKPPSLTAVSALSAAGFKRPQDRLGKWLKLEATGTLKWNSGLRIHRPARLIDHRGEVNAISFYLDDVYVGSAPQPAAKPKRGSGLLFQTQ